MEKRKEKLTLGASSQGRRQAPSLHMPTSIPQDGHLEFYRERFGGEGGKDRQCVQESRPRACGHGRGLVCVQLTFMSREGDVWGVVLWAFHCNQGFSGLAVGMI